MVIGAWPLWRTGAHARQLCHPVGGTALQVSHAGRAPARKGSQTWSLSPNPCPVWCLRVCFRIPTGRDGGQPRDPARKRAQGDVGHRSSAVTPQGARLAPSLRAGAAGFAWRCPGPSTWNHRASGPCPSHARPALPARPVRILKHTLRPGPPWGHGCSVMAAGHAGLTAALPSAGTAGRTRS